MMAQSDYESLRAAFPWVDIPGCPGRYRLEVGLPEMAPAQIAGTGAETVHATSPVCRDPIELVHLPGGGALLSYRRGNGTYVHTLNTPSGLARKLAQLFPRGVPRAAAPRSPDAAGDLEEDRRDHHAR